MNYKLIGDNQESNLIKTIFKNRNIDYEKRYEFLNPAESCLENPYNYKNMKEAVDRILKAIKENELIDVVVDSDCDGYCSASMIVGYLKEIYDDSKITYSIHDKKVHGITKEIIEKCKFLGIKLLIVPDAGSENYEQHKELLKAGIDTIVIDHHIADRYSENAIVVNNQLDAVGNKSLSGAGMVLKVLEALDIKLMRNRASEYYDVASVAIIADVMKIDNEETRFYTNSGLRNINNSLLNELFVGGKTINFQSVSWDVAPVINAIIRMGTMEEKNLLFLALLGETFERLITVRGKGEIYVELPVYVQKMASKIKARQTMEIKKALETHSTIVSALDVVLCFLDETVPKALTGLIANKLTDMYDKPCLALITSDNEIFTGSARSPEKFGDFKDTIIDTGLFELAQGHQRAFGIKITEKKLQEYINYLKDKKVKLETYYYVDKAYDNNVSAFDILALDELKNHWSFGFEKPKFYIKLDITNDTEISIIGNKRDTIRIKKDGIIYIKFKCSEEEIIKITNSKLDYIEAIGTFEVNRWMNNAYPQVFLEKTEYHTK